MNPIDRVEEHLRALARETALERVCSRCGHCCSFAFRMETPRGTTRHTIPSIRSRPLIPQSNGTTTCAVYPTRREKAPWCGKSLPIQLANGVCSRRCAYLRGAPWLRYSEPLAKTDYHFLALGLLGQIERVEDTLNPDDVRRFRAQCTRLLGSDR